MAAITLVTGVLFLLLAVFRMGWIAQFLSKAVVTGFLAGAAVDVVIGELPKLTGHLVARATAPGASSRRGSARSATSAGRRCSSAVVALARDPRPALRGARGPRRAGAGRRRPARLVRCSTSARTASRWSATCRAACRRPQLPDLDIVRRPLSRRSASPPSALLLIGFSQTAGDARAFATRHRYRIDVNQESVAQGMANVGAGRVPGDAGLDQPLGELAQRVGGRAHAGGVARHRRARARDAARPRAAVLGPAEGRARRRSSSTPSCSG